MVGRRAAWPSVLALGGRLFVPRLWSGGEVAVVAGGPSLCEEDLALLRQRGCPIVAVNDAYRRIRPDVIYAADDSWWSAYGRPHRWPCDGKDYPGATEVGATCWTGSRSAACTTVNFISVVDAPGLSLEPGRLHHGGNGGYQAVNWTVLAGASRVLLLAFDMMARADGERHWFGNHPGRLNKASPYGLWAERFASMLPDLERAGVEIVNCSRESAITCFPRVRLEKLS